jgi:hypothetical protein
MPYGARGRPVSWIAVAVIVTGFTLGGLGLVLGPAWWLFWTGTAVTVGGLVFAWAIGIMEDYSEERH